MRPLVVAALVAVVLLGGCALGDDSTSARPGTQSAPSTEARSAALATMPGQRFGDTAPFTLIVSNQSFARPEVQITVRVDGRIAVDDWFDVGNQHDWRFSSYDLAAGDHEVNVDAAGMSTSVAVAVVGNDAPLWLLIEHWDDHLRADLFTDRPLFA